MDAGHRASRTASSLAWLTAALGAFSVALPFLGQAIGLSVDVPFRLEIIDHVVPGILVTLCGALCWIALKRGRSNEDLTFLIAAGVAMLGGLWITATHIPLMIQASDGLVPWDGALWHSLPGTPIAFLAGAQFFVSEDPGSASSP